jgi:hypothetical protein
MLGRSGRDLNGVTHALTHAGPRVLWSYPKARPISSPFMASKGYGGHAHSPIIRKHIQREFSIKF